MARGVSTVLDVAVCLMLVGAAIGTLAVAPPTGEEHAQPDADRTATRIASVTATVEETNHSVHDTLAGHLATASATNATISSSSIQETSYPESVRNETTDVTDERVFVTATWSPYPDSPLAGVVTAGSEPPPSAETATTVLEVDSGMASPTDDDSFDALAADIAAAYVRWLFPPERTNVLLRDGRTAARAANRYRTAAAVLDTGVEDSINELNASRANEELSCELADRIEDDLERQYGTVSAAAQEVRIDSVEVVVRRWEP